MRLCLGTSMPLFSVLLVSLAVCAPPGATASAAPPATKPAAGGAAEPFPGKRLFESQCARCHGISGHGGFGPSLARPQLRRAPDDAALRNVIQNGIPNTAMPGEWDLDEREVAAVAAYVRSLGRLPPERLPGDSARGKALYEGKGGCAACHVARGAGSGLGPDLTEIGALRGASYLKTALLDPGKELPDRPVPYEPNSYAGYLPVRARLTDGREVVGYRVNEDSFTIQLRDATSRLHSFRKAEVASLDRQFGGSLMPRYADTLSAAEIDDLVAYLASLKGQP
jgi:cytochrome c oxidase cbb3-type subunit III